jgi:hypothetical protein
VSIPVPEFRLEHTATSYSRIHGLLNERRGPACDHLCSCGEPAVRWAYQHSAGEAELKNSKGHPYSLNLLDYEPMCSQCHHDLDFRGGFKKRLDVDPELKAQYRKQLREARMNDKSRRRCSCGREMASRSIGRHQKASGCVGWEKVS